MTSVFEIIQQKITQQNTFFVFPSETTAALWARKICLYGKIRSLSPDRFLAWDRFKEKTIRAKEKKRKPVSSLIRRLFAFALARQNISAPFLKEIIPVNYAEGGAVFADSIAMILSSLSRWEELYEAAGRKGPAESADSAKSALTGIFRDDGEDRDLRIIKSKYAAFLEEHGLFEPAWEKTFFRDDENRYIIFFPEALADFGEYAQLLDSSAVSLFFAVEPSRTTGPSNINELAEKPGLRFFDSARQEIRSAVLELRRLHETGLPYEDMALTLPDFETITPYVERELALHDIPFNRRAGKNLGEYPLGRIFSLAAECTSSLFSFDALKSLLLNNSIPWKEPEKNSTLIDYGVKNHCVAPFRDRFRTVDAWEEGFKQNPSEELAAYYGKLKKSLNALTNAKSFRKIREQYYIFRSFLDMEKCSAESDAVLARCIEELSGLIEAEETFPDIAAADPFSFFVSHLLNKNYVYARNEGGVNLYDYPVAAAAPFGCHFLLNASQAAAAVLHKPLPFLRQDKRARLGITDTDASVAVISLYNIAPWKEYSCHTWISASEKTFAGWAIPHSVFALNMEKQSAGTENAANLFRTERQWRAGGKKPEQLYSVQREGFKRWDAVLQSAENETPSKAATQFQFEVELLLRERIRSKNRNYTGDTDAVDDCAAGVIELSVSATDLNEFFTCSLFWLYRRIFRLEPYQKDAALLDDESRGLIYHEILHLLFDRIAKTDKYFLGKNLARYYGWLEEISDSVLRSDHTLRRALVYPLIAPLAAAMNRRLRALLKAEAQYFDGFKIKELEQRYDIFRGHLRLTGRIDRVSLDSSDPASPMIIDYKTSYVPPASHCRWDEENGLRDFQIPMYVKLYEAAAGVEVSRAFFVKINEHKFIPVMGEFRGKDFSREKYNSTMDALEKEIEYFDSTVSSLNFIPGTIPYKTCVSCEFKTVCRSVYSLNPSSGDC